MRHDIALHGARNPMRPLLKGMWLGLGRPCIGNLGSMIWELVGHPHVQRETVSKCTLRKLKQASESSKTMRTQQGQAISGQLPSV